MRPIILKYFLMLIFLVFWQEGMGQDVIITPQEELNPIKEDNEVIYVHNKHEQLTQINFVCRTSGDVCTSFNILENNPFETLSYPIQTPSSSYERFPSYDFSSIDSRRVTRDLLPQLNYEDSRWGECKIYNSSTKIVAARTDENNDYLLIGYTLILYGEGGGVVASNTQFQILNKNGEMVFSMKNINEGFGRAVLTPNAHYLAYVYGGFGGAHGDCVVGGNSGYMGLKIVDTHTGEIVVDVLDEEKEANDPRVFYGKILFTYGLKNRDETYQLFDFIKNTSYLKTFSFEEYSHLKAITETGFVFKDATNSEKEIIYLYERDFIQQPIK